MGTQSVGQIAEEALAHLSRELAAGRSQALEDFLAAQARFHRYSCGNVLLIARQRPTATRVAGYHTWHELGRHVRRGEKGIMIHAPVRVKDPELALSTASRQALDAFRLTGFRAAYVFDVAQTEGRPLPTLATTGGNPDRHLESLKAIVAQRGISLEYDATIEPAQGVSSGGQIRVLPDLRPAEEFSVLAHELAHELLHHGPDRSQFTRQAREIQAEAVSYVICKAVGLDSRRAHADYIALYQGDKESLAESLAVIHDASAQVLRDLMPQEREHAGPDRASNPQQPAPPRDADRSLDPSGALWER